jgi:tetratricopeptide (TPR) repeat protein
MQSPKFLHGSLLRFGTGGCLFLLICQLSLLAQSEETPNPLIEAYHLAWAGEYQKAQSAFIAILDQDDDNPDALSGLGYAYAWAGNYREAKAIFIQLEKAHSGSWEAAKGLAYVALWNRKGQEAVQRFKILTRKKQAEPDLWIGLGLAHLLNLDQQEARQAFVRAGKLAPGQTDAGVFLQQLQSSPAWMEVNLWGGFSQVAAQNQWGLRAGQVMFHPHHKFQIWGRYDNSLSLENADFLRRNLSSPIWFTGGLYNWNEKLTTRIETGLREIPGIGRQYFFQAEQVMFVGERSAIKTGGFYAPRSDGKTEWLGYFSGFIPLNYNLALEPTYFLSRSATSLWEHRWQLDANLRQDAKGYRLQGGVLYGWSPQLTTAEQVVKGWGLNFQGQATLGKQHWMLFLLRYESSPYQNFFTASVGARLRIEK